MNPTPNPLAVKAAEETKDYGPLTEIASRHIQPLLAERDALNEMLRTVSAIISTNPYDGAQHVVHDVEKYAAEKLSMERELSALKVAEKNVSDAYLRVRELLGAWDTNHGGENRFEVTEQKIVVLKAKCAELENGWHERHVMQLAAISSQAMMNTDDSVDEPLKCHEDYKTTALYDVNKAIHREIELRAQLSTLQAACAAKDEALRAADDDIREHLQVCKYNLRGQINTGEIIEKPNPPQLVHEEGIKASERVRNNISAALSPASGSGWLSPAEAERRINEEVAKVTRIRCAKHHAVPAMNSEVHNGGECPVCAVRAAQIRALEWAEQLIGWGQFNEVATKLKSLREGGELV